MKSVQTEEYHELFAKLPLDVQKQARKANRLFEENPYHPSLRFKCIDKKKSRYSVRVNKSTSLQSNSLIAVKIAVNCVTIAVLVVLTQQVKRDVIKKEDVMDFSLTDEQRMIQQTVRRFVERELMPLEKELLLSEGKYPTGIEPGIYHSLQMKAKEMGFWGINTPEEYGGANLGAVMTALISMELGRTLVPFTFGGGDAFLQIPQTSSVQPGLGQGKCGPVSGSAQVTCKFQQFRLALGYGSLTKRGLSAAASAGFDSETKKLQFATAQTSYNWDCCGITLEYRRYAIANVRNENLFRFTFSLANIGSFGNLRRQERLY